MQFLPLCLARKGYFCVAVHIDDIPYRQLKVR